MPEVAQPQAQPIQAPAQLKFQLPPDEEPKVTPPAPAATGSEASQDTGTQATLTAPEGDKPDEVTPEQAAKREGRRFERKLDKAYKRAAEAQARAELLEKQLAEYRQPKAPEGEPKLEQFDDIEKYATAKAEYAKVQAVKGFETTQRQQAQTQEQQRIATAWEAQTEKGADKYDDWTEVVGDVKPTSPWAIAMMDAENAADIAYHLGKNGEDFKRIATLNPVPQIREIGKLSAKLAATPEKPKVPSKAPAPINPLSGAAPTVTEGPSENDDTATWIKKRQKQVHGRR
jgi:hypothetical protein